MRAGRILTFLIFTLLSIKAFSQSASIVGFIKSQNISIPFAQLVIPELNQYSTADSNGFYVFKNIGLGNYKLEIYSTGFKKTIIPFEIKEFKEIQLDIDISNSQIISQEVVILENQNNFKKSNNTINIEVYNIDFFKKNPAVNFFEALPQINGVRTQNNCNLCNTGDIHINGLEGPYTTVLIDDMPLVSSLSSVYGLMGIPKQIIENIEVIKGPTPVIYGSESIGGTINIKTVNPNNAKLFSIDIFGTSIGEFNLDLATKFKIGKKIQVLNAVNYFNFSNKIDRNNDNFTDQSISNNLSFFQKWSIKRRKDRIFNLAARYLKENRWGGDLNWNNSYRGTDIIYGESIYTNRFEVIGIYQIPSSENIFFSYSYVFHDQDSRYGINSFIASEHVAFSQLRWEKKIKNHKLNSGLTFRYLNYQDNTSVYFSTLSADKYRLINYLPGIFIQDEFEYKNFFVFGGFRYDYNSYHGSIFTPRLGFKYQLTPFQILRFNFGRGFRVVNLFSEDHAALTGSREIEIRNSLNPEQSLNFILNYQNKIFSKRNFYLGIDASIFYNYFSNRIIGNYDIDPNKIIYDNLDGYSESYGLGLNLDLSFNFGLKFLAGISLMENYIIENNIKTIPILTEKISSNWSLGYSFKKLKLDLDYTANLYGPMRLPLAGDLDPRKPFSPWWSIHNIQVNYKGLKNTEIYAGVKNIFDWTPFKDNPFVISRAHDPFDRLVQYDNNGNVIPTVENPYALTFDAGYVYAPNIGLRIFLGFRYSF